MKHIKIIFFLLLPIFVYSQTINPRVDKKNFTFVVLGDRTGSAEQEIFEQILLAIDSIKPDFIINVGDLIEGYTKNETTINLEWDSIFSNLGKWKQKFYFTPGNHDIWDSLSFRIYLYRIGYQKPYYAFSIGNNHFVVLDNSRQEKVNEIDTIQLNWLNSTLSKLKQSATIFCFMHKSFWKDAYINNKPDTFHKLFVKYGVDYVFSGHDHFYCQLIWDGITYTQVGPSGSRYKIYRKQELGAFQNFSVVSVKNNKVNIKVIKVEDRDTFKSVKNDKVNLEVIKADNHVTSKAKFSELNADVVTLQDIQEIKKIEQAVEILPFAIDKTNSIILKITNINETPITTQCEWITENSQWYISPSNPILTILPDSNLLYEFSTSIKSDSIYPLPKIKLHYPYANSKKIYLLERLLPIKLTTTCIKTQRPINIDGKLDEPIWHPKLISVDNSKSNEDRFGQKSKPIYIFGSSDGKISLTDPWQVQFAYDENYIYLGAKMNDDEIEKISTTIKERDEKVYNDDHLNFILQPDVKGDTYYQFFVNANGAVMDRKCYLIGNDSKKDAKWNCNIIAKGQVMNTKSFKGWTLEIAIPLKDLSSKTPTEWGFNLVRFQKRKETVSIYSVPFEHNPKSFATLKFIE
ncbi:MAG: metallophosphoesterase [candidate division WOR-3 bacterium]|nr:metallophosphoesterase [candidate division WOR-3 bacterium]